MKFTKLVPVLGAALLSHQGYADNTELDKTIIASETEVDTEIFVIDAVEIDRKGINNLTDLVRHTPGVQVNDNGDRFNDNGFNIRGLEGDAISITIDGISQGETLSPDSFRPYGMFGSNRAFVDPETIKQLSITKGPDSVLSGSGALGGAVAVTTKDAADFLDGDKTHQTAGKVKVGFDDRDEETLVSGALANRSGAFEALLMYVLRDGGELKSHDDGSDVLGSERGQADPFDIETQSVLAKLSYKLTDDQRIGVVYENSDRDTTGEIFSRDSAAYYDFSSVDESTRERLGVFYEIEGANTVLFDSLSATLDRQETFNHGVTIFAFDSGAFRGAPDRSNDILRTEDRSYNQETLEFAVDLEKSFGADDAHTLVYGFEYADTSVSNELFDRRFATVDPNSEQTQNLRDPSWVPDTDKTLFTVYALDTYKLNNQFTFNLGARYENAQYEPTVDENFSDPTGTAVTDSEFSVFAGQASVDYTFAEGHTLSLLFAQGYKAPTTQEIYLDVEVAEDALVDAITGDTFDDWEEIANPDLEAEESSSIELSYIWKTNRAYLKINAYMMTNKNRIESVSLTRDLGQTIEIAQPCFPQFGCDPSNPPANTVVTQDAYNQAQNVGETSINGIEIESAFYLSDAWYLTFAATQLQGEHDTARAGSHDEGDELVTISPDTATLGLSYQPSERWNIDADVTWTDGKDETDDLSFTSRNNGSGIVHFPDSSLVLDLSAYYEFNDNFSISANIHNLTDENYIRWEVINNVRPGTGGFFSGASGDGYERFTQPGRSFSIYTSYKF